VCVCVCFGAFVGLDNNLSSNVAFSNITYRTVQGILLTCSVNGMWDGWYMENVCGGEGGLEILRKFGI